MRKIYTLLVLLLIIMSSVHAQQVLKENVPIVKSNYSESSKEFLENLAQRIQKKGYHSAADYLRRITKGGFGSGFVYVDSVAGKSYIVTNRHVISQASSVNLTFTHLDEELELDSCAILAIDETLDLALIELPEKAKGKIGKGLTIFHQNIEEGSDVYSAGFPGLAGKPSWQLGRGIVSNSSVKNDMFSGTEKYGAIQHTAPIDPGSSGGPLMIKKDDQYQVIGLNTWGVSDRENAYFAISNKAMSEFLARYMGKTHHTEADLERRAKKLLSQLKDDYVKTSPYISDEYVSNISTTDFFEVIINIPDSVSDVMGKRFDGGHPIDGVRVGVSYLLSQQANKSAVDFVRIESTGKATEKKVILKTAGEEFDTYWTYSLGEWRLKEYTQLDFKNLDENGVSKSFRRSKQLLLRTGMGIGNDEVGIQSYTANLLYPWGSYFAYGFEFSYTRMKYNTVKIVDEGRNEENVMLPFGTLGFHMRTHLPIKVNKLYVIPSAYASGGITGDALSGFSYSFGGDLNLSYRFSYRISLLAGVGYQNLNIESDNTDVGSSFNLLQFTIGIAY